MAGSLNNKTQKKKIDFDDLTFNDFKNRAKLQDISNNEKIGFPDNYREGYTNPIFNDIKTKLLKINEENKIILDIGCGCSDLAFKIIDYCERKKHNLLLLDSQEMLDLLPDKPFIEKFPSRFPKSKKLINKYAGKIDAIIIYSVLQHVFLESNMYNFLDAACSLLNRGGDLLIGDIPNVSMRKRFFASHTGVEFHKTFTGKNENPKVDHLIIEENKIDDGVVFGILHRYHTYLCRQNVDLPMMNRREDILITRP